MTSYDSKVIQQYADTLYSRAFGLVVSYALVGAAIGWVAFYFLQPLIAAQLELRSEADQFPLKLISMFIGTVVGGVWGYWKGFDLRLWAQVALCQMKIENWLEKIERNTSHPVEIAQDTNPLEKVERNISQSKEIAAAASFGR